jgi:hypothetical protein
VLISSVPGGPAAIGASARDLIPIHFATITKTKTTKYSIHTKTSKPIPFPVPQPIYNKQVQQHRFNCQSSLSKCYKTPKQTNEIKMCCSRFPRLFISQGSITRYFKSTLVSAQNFGFNSASNHALLYHNFRVHAILF